MIMNVLRDYDYDDVVVVIEGGKSQGDKSEGIGVRG